LKSKSKVSRVSIRVLSLMAFFALPNILLAQFVASGKITDRAGSPFQGVSVAENGTTSGTITDADGLFSLPVSSANATLFISFVGYKAKEVKWMGEFLIIKLKEDCHVDFLDQKTMEFYAKSGVLTTPVGAEIDMSFAIHGQTALTGRFSYQANTSIRGNEFLNIDVALRHVIAACDHNLDLNLSYRTIRWNLNYDLESYTLEGKLNFTHPNIFRHGSMLYLGFGRAELNHTGEIYNPNQHGYLAGLGVWVGIVQVSGKAMYWRDFWELQGEIKRDFKKVILAARFLQVEDFSELTLAAGLRIHYR
jgi:hypothetical protein